MFIKQQDHPRRKYYSRWPGGAGVISSGFGHPEYSQLKKNRTPVLSVTELLGISASQLVWVVVRIVPKCPPLSSWYKVLSLVPNSNVKRNLILQE